MDINSRQQIEQIVAAFYKRLMDDPAIGFYFTDVAKIDLTNHLPKVADFWEFQVLGNPVYQGDFFQTHRHIYLKAGLLKDHFDWWLVLFNQAVDEVSQGPRAEIMKRRAAIMAKGMFEALNKGETSMDESQQFDVEFYSP